MRLPSDVTVREAVDVYRRHPAVLLYAEPNYLLTATSIPNDPQFSLLWALNNTGQTFGRAGADIDAAPTPGTSRPAAAASSWR